MSYEPSRKDFAHFLYAIRRLLIEIGSGRNSLPSPFALCLWRDVAEAQRGKTNAVASSVGGLALDLLGCSMQEAKKGARAASAQRDEQDSTKQSSDDDRGEQQDSDPEPVCSPSALAFSMAVLAECGFKDSQVHGEEGKPSSLISFDQDSSLFVNALCVDLITVLPHCPNPSRFDILMGLFLKASDMVQRMPTSNPAGVKGVMHEVELANPWLDAMWRVLSQTISPKPPPRQGHTTAIEHWYLRSLDLCSWSVKWMLKLTRGRRCFPHALRREFVQRSQRHLDLLISYGDVTQSDRNRLWASSVVQCLLRDVSALNSELESPPHVSSLETSVASAARCRSIVVDGVFVTLRSLKRAVGCLRGDCSRVTSTVAQLNMLLMDWVAEYNWSMSAPLYVAGSNCLRSNARVSGGAYEKGETDNPFLLRGPSGRARETKLDAIAACMSNVHGGPPSYYASLGVDDGGVGATILRTHLGFFTAAYPLKMKSLHHALIARQNPSDQVPNLNFDSGIFELPPDMSYILFHRSTIKYARSLRRRALELLKIDPTPTAAMVVDDQGNDRERHDSAFELEPPLMLTLLRFLQFDLPVHDDACRSEESARENVSDFGAKRAAVLSTPLADEPAFGSVDRPIHPEQGENPGASDNLGQNEINPYSSAAARKTGGENHHINHRDTIRHTSIMYVTRPGKSDKSPLSGESVLNSVDDGLMRCAPGTQEIKEFRSKSDSLQVLTQSQQISSAHHHPPDALKSLPGSILRLLLMELLHALKGPDDGVRIGAFAGGAPTAGAAFTQSLGPSFHGDKFQGGMNSAAANAEILSGTGSGTSAVPPIFKENIISASMAVTRELIARMGDCQSYKDIVSTVNDLVLCDRDVDAAALLVGLLDNEIATRHVANQLHAAVDKSSSNGTIINTIKDILTSIKACAKHPGIRFLSASILQDLGETFPGPAKWGAAVLFDFDLCVDHISFPAEKVASHESRKAILKFQGITDEEESAYGRRVFLAFEQLRKEGIPIVIVTRNSEANVRFALRHVAGVPSSWVSAVLSAYDIEAAQNGKPVQKWEIVDTFFQSKGWISSHWDSTTQPQVKRAVFIDDSSTEIRSMRESPLGYVSCVQAWRPGKTPAGKKARYVDAKELFHKLPGVFNSHDIFMDLWGQLMPGTARPSPPF